MSVCYLDVLDEITDAVARLRVATDNRVIIVLPPGSRIGTSRINFRLLQREAETRGLELNIVSGEPVVRALALSAGIAPYATVAAAEQSDQPEPTGPPLLPAPYQAPAGEAFQAVRPRIGVDPSTTLTEAQAAGIAAESGALGAAAGVRRGTAAQRAASGAPAVDPRWTRSETGTYAVMPRAANAGTGTHGAGDAWTGDLGAAEVRGRSRARRRVRRVVGWAIRLAIVAALVGGVAYGAYEYLPTATVSLKPGTQTFGPQTFTVIADPAVAVADSVRGKVPAEHVTVPLAETGTFPASGHIVNQTKAQGTVTFTSTNTFIEVPIPGGTVVQTANGTMFQTIDFVSLPKATAVPPGASVDVPVKAAAAGLSGNVNAGDINVLPASLKQLLVTVTNAQQTSGGKRTTITTITKDDYDGAIAQLTQKLNTDLATSLADPTTTPHGLTIYPQTASLGRVSASAAAGDLVGTTADTFNLSVDSQGTVLAVDEALVGSVAGKELIATAAAGVRVFPETVTTQLSDGIVNGTTITYQVIVQALQYTPVDPAQLEKLIVGRTLSEARSILADYGTVEVSIWPDFVPTIPNDVRRINLTIANPEIPR